MSESPDDVSSIKLKQSKQCVIWSVRCMIVIIEIGDGEDHISMPLLLEQHKESLIIDMINQHSTGGKESNTGDEIRIMDTECVMFDSSDDIP